MGNVALQIASFISQLKVLSDSQHQGIDNMISVIISEGKKEGANFNDGVAFGSFVAWGILHIEEDILDSMKKIAEALTPLGLSGEIEMLARQELFHPQAESNDILPDLQKAQQIIKKRLWVLSRVEKSLLAVPEEEIAASYSPEALRNFQNYWDGELRQLVDNV